MLPPFRKQPYKYIIIFFSVYLLLGLTLGSALAQTKTNKTDLNIGKDQIGNLIETLESETARKEFINNLKTLVKANSKTGNAQDNDKKNKNINSEIVEMLPQTLDLQETAKDWLTQYNDFLAEHDLNSSSVGKTGLSLGSVFVALIFAFIVQKIGTNLRDWLIRIKEKFGLQHGRFRIYARIFRYVGYTIIFALLLYSIAIIWEITQFNFLTSDMALNFFGNILSLTIISLIALLLWEIINISIEYGIMKSASADQSRLRTLLPIMQNVLLVMFAVLFTLVILSEVGVDIMPLLAGAGIVGIAIGFGAQTIVKDFITGFMIILEDLIQVGDVASLGGKSGLIEKITIRKVQLRGLDGIVYTIPFSEISIVENMTKDYSFYLLDVGVAYRENPDEVIEYMKEIDEDMRSDDEFKDYMLEPIEILGVDQFADSAVIIKARLKTRPIKQWVVGREYNRRMKHKFDEHNVEIPFPHQTIYFGEDKNGHAPPAPVALQNKSDNTDTPEKKDNSKAKSKSNKEEKPRLNKKEKNIADQHTDTAETE